MRIGIDLGGTKIEGIVLADSGDVVKKIRVSTPGTDYQATISSVCGVIKELQHQSKTRMTVGIGSPGALAKATGLMKNCNSICLNNQPLQHDIEAILGYDIKLENDANCFALSEAHYGSANQARSMFGVIIGTGTGGGIVINRELVTGPNSIAGEWGHNSLPSNARHLIGDDRLCYCGRKNCIETVLSGRGLGATHLERTGTAAPAVDIAAGAEAEEQDCLDSISIYSKQLASCLTTVVNLIDPEIIVLGGGLSNIQSLYESVIQDMDGLVFTDKIETKISRPSFGDASGARGAACLWPLTG
jgi:predicted NBD/HSP70 family sugar kinase